MEKLLDAVAAVVCLISPEKVQAIANRVRRTDPSKASGALSGAVDTPAATGVVDQLIEAWRATTVSAEELASMLLAAGHVFTKTAGQQSTELVWTGPTTPFVSARRTEQALLQVINVAEQTLFITSANLTGHAMEKNMEAGVLISGGHIPRLLDDHLRSLVDTRLVTPV